MKEYESFELRKSKALKYEEYKGFTIIVDNYLIGLSTFENGKTVKYGIDIILDWGNTSNNYYEIWEDGECLSNTLDNDDKMWTVERAIKSAKEDIDSYLNNNRQRTSNCTAYLR